MAPNVARSHKTPSDHPSRPSPLLRRSGTAVVVITATLLAAACGVGLGPTLSAPRNVVASSGELNQITLQWDEVPGATRYYVYRGETADAPLWEEGAGGPIPFATTNITTFVDMSFTTADQSFFYYQVSAVAEYRDEESPPSDVVQGRWVDGPNEWQAGTIVGAETASTLELEYDPAIVFARP